VDYLVINDGSGHFLKLPALTTAQRNVIIPANGMVIYNTDNSVIEFYEGGWQQRWNLSQLGIGGTVVITAARLLQNVTTDATIITSGELAIARMPRDAAGLVLEAQGTGFYPMYVNPNGRYTPAGHNHAAGNITSGVLDEARCPNVYSNKITFNGGIITNSVNCANFSATDIVFENEFRITEAEKLGLGKGLAFLDDEGKLLMRLDGHGNLHVRGKIIEDVKS
jgi:hypothetical protein